MLLPEGISMRSLFLWHQISDWDPFNLNATPELHLPKNVQIFSANQLWEWFALLTPYIIGCTMALWRKCVI